MFSFLPLYIPISSFLFLCILVPLFSAIVVTLPSSQVYQLLVPPEASAVVLVLVVNAISLAVGLYVKGGASGCS